MNIGNYIVKDFEDIKSLSPQVKFLLGFQLLILFIISVLVGLIFFPGRNITDTGEPTATLTKNQKDAELKGSHLTLTPSEQIVKLGETTTLSVNIAGQAVPAVDVVLSYDPSVLSITTENINNGDVYERIIKKEIKDGRIYFSATKAFDQIQNPKLGVVCTITAKPLKKSDSTKIEFVEGQNITAKSIQNTLSSISNAVLRIYD